MQKKNNFASNFLVLLSGNVVSQIVPFLFAPLLARIFAPEDFALQGNFLALTGLIAIIASGRYDIAIVLPKSLKKATNLVSLAMKISIIISILSILIIFLDDEIASLYKNEDLTNVLILVPLGIYLISYNSIYNQWLTRLKKYKELSILKIILTLSIHAVTITLGWFNFKTIGLIVGWLAGTFINNLILNIIFRKTYDKKLIDKTIIKSVAKEYKDFPIINSAHAFSDVFFAQFLLYTIITRGYGSVALGLFFMMNRYLKAPIKLIASSVGQLYYREANELINDGKMSKIIFLQSLKTTVFFAVPFLIIVFFFAPTLFEWYLGEQWIESGEYAKIMAIPIFLNFLTSPVSSTPILYRKQKQAFFFSIFGYLLSTSTLLLGVYFKYDFKETLIIFAIAQSVYYTCLLIWYAILTNTKL